ncbi:uncharacterized protein EDB91DRAFT_1246930 [Suillus paluster]|uniref:uncharacterized protein n=1 Tax=Suillus paluster TaxID=48578 RepID=UPI001B85FB72|nr:uncharacterized protein EDB91DRAFT_1246930 [Suillus paluster]KAG1744049.1 hypothetical protein EDB91DRAFT_1246930 [Suillus paluster]
MSRASKPYTLAQLNDITLGSFSNVPASETLNHLVRYLSTWSGSDKFFTLVQYTLKLIVPFLHWRARLQHRAGIRKDASSKVAPSLTSFASIVSDAKMLGRFWGLLPIFQWMISMERNPPPTRTLHTIERLQGWSMLGFYPLEHLYYLRAHNLIPTSIPSLSAILGRSSKRISLNENRLIIWSCRCWLLYTVLQFAHLREDIKLLLTRQKNLRKGKGFSADDKEDLRKRWDALLNELVANTANLPLALHWSLESGIFKNDIWVTIFSLINGIAAFRGGWRATALPSVKAAASPDPSDEGN